MRKALGKPTRQRFTARLRDVAPDFEHCGQYDLKGTTWSFMRQASSMMQCISYQQHRHEDAFTVELSWSQHYPDPAQPPFGSPDDPFAPDGCRFRLGAFWEAVGDYWWAVSDPPPDILSMPPEEYLEVLAHPERLEPAAQAEHIAAAVEDAVGRIERFALPYFDRVRQWALETS